MSARMGFGRGARVRCGGWFVLSALLLCLAFAGRGQADEAAKPQLPIRSDQMEAEKKVRSVYAEQFGERGTSERRSLARMLYRQALHGGDEPLIRYTMFRLAKELATQTGDADTAVAAIAGMHELYEIDRQAMELNVLRQVSRTADSPAAHAAVAMTGLRLYDEALRKDDFVAASQFVNAARLSALRSKQAGLVNECVARQREVAMIQSFYRNAKGALQILKDRPDDPEANTIAGTYLCLYKGEFADGLLMLAKGADAQLRQLAQDDLADPEEPAAQRKMGNAWWDYAQALTSPLAKRNVEDHARYWYRKAVRRLTGLAKAEVEQRLAPDAVQYGEKTFAAGIVGIYRDGDENGLIKARRVDPAISFNWRQGSPAQGMVRDEFTVEWVGWIRAPREGHYRFTVRADDSVTMYIEDKLIVSGRFTDATGTAYLYKGFNPIRVVYHERVENAHCELSWQPPGQDERQVVPEEVFYHEPSQE